MLDPWHFRFFATILLKVEHQEKREWLVINKKSVVSNLLDHRRWTSPRRKRFWVVVAVLAYTLIGFFVAPPLVRSQLESTLTETLQRPVSIGELAINPFSLSATAADLSLTEQDGANIVSIGELYINFALSSAFHRAWTFSEFNIVDPRIDLRRSESGAINLLELMPESEPEEPGGVPPLLFQQLAIINGAVQVTDDYKTPTYTTTFAPIDISVTDLGTRQGQKGNHQLVLYSESGAKLALSGDVVVVPLRINGRLQASGPYLPLVYDYIKNQLDVRLDRGNLELALDFGIADTPEHLSATVNNVELAVTDVQVTDKDGGGDMLTLDSLSLAGFEFAWPEKKVSATSLRLTRPQLTLVREANGGLNWQDLLAGNNNGGADGDPAAGDPAAGDPLAIESTDAGAAMGKDAIAEAESGGASPDSQAVQSRPVESLAVERQRAEIQTRESQAAESQPEESRSKNSQAKDKQVPLPDWTLELSAVSIDDMAVNFEDRQLEPAATFNLENISLSVENLANRAGQVMPVTAAAQMGEDGALDLGAEIQLFPAWQVSGDLTVNALPLPLFQPYVAENIEARLASGELSVTATLSGSADAPIAVTADLAVAGLELVDTDSQPLVSWTRLGVPELAFDTDPLTLRAGAVGLEEPFVRFIIHEDGTTNFHRILVNQTDDQASAPDQQPATSERATAPGEPTDSPPAESDEGNNTSSQLGIAIARLKVEQGSVDFADYSLPIPFEHRLSQLEGELVDFYTAQETRASLDLSGQVGEYGAVEVSGELSPWDFTADSELSLDLENITMPHLDPYTIEFVGRRIRAGKMDLDLDYRVEATRLTGSNNVVISDFRLGEKVPHEGALDLPLELAVALLKGPDGRIDLNLPVSGDMGNPQFSVADIIGKAFANLLTKAVTAPFRLLGSLVGADSENFDRIYFDAGSATLAPPQREKLQQLLDALNQRPQLVLEVTGVFHPEADALALKKARLESDIDTARRETYGGDSDLSRSEQRLRVMETLLESRSSPEAWQQLRNEFPTTDGEMPKGYRGRLRENLLETITLAPAELEQLARQRAAAIRSILIEDGQLSAGRLETPAVEKTVKQSDEGISLALKISQASLAAEQ